MARVQVNYRFMKRPDGKYESEIQRIGRDDLRFSIVTNGKSETELRRAILEHIKRRKEAGQDSATEDNAVPAAPEILEV